MYVWSQLLRAQLENLTSDPSPGVAGRVFYNTTTKIAKLDTGTQIIPLGSGGGGGFVNWRVLSNGPSEPDPTLAAYSGAEVWNFDYLSSQEVWAELLVPLNYVAGTQIFIQGAQFAVGVTSGKILFKTTAYLLTLGTTVLGTYPNSRQSTNSEVTAAGVASTITAVGDLDLTDSTGKINAVSVAPGDLLLVKLIRDTASESSSAAADASLIRNCMTPKFS